MKLIIDIEKDYYEIIKYNVGNGYDYKPLVIIANGIPYEEKPQGEWINPADCLCYQCSNCGEYTNNEGTVAEGLFEYCPKCGADMRKGSAE